jgi:hypothetical protein
LKSIYNNFILAKVINNILRKFKFWKKIILIITNNIPNNNIMFLELNR